MFFAEQKHPQRPQQERLQTPGTTGYERAEIDASRLRDIWRPSCTDPCSRRSEIARGERPPLSETWNLCRSNFILRKWSYYPTDLSAGRTNLSNNPDVHHSRISTAQLFSVQNYTKRKSAHVFVPSNCTILTQEIMSANDYRNQKSFPTCKTCE